MSNKIALKTPGQLTVHTKSGHMGVASNLSASDIQIPVLMLMQANSTFVTEDDNINSGDFINSITHEKWGKKDSEPLELIIFDMFKTQIVSDVTDTKKWMETNTWTEDMELAEYEVVINNRTIRREKCFNYMVFRSLDVREVANPVTGEVTFKAQPIVIKFKGGSMKNGKRLNQVFSDYEDFGAPSWATTFHVFAKYEENDKGKYWVWDFKRGEQSLMEQQVAAEALFIKMKAAKATMKVVDSDEAPMDDIEVTPRNVTKAPPKNHADHLQGDIV